MVRHKEIDVMLTTSDVAHVLCMYVNSVRRWSNQGILTAYRIGPGGDQRFRREDIASFLLELTLDNSSKE